MLIIDSDEVETLVSQSVIPSKQHLGGAKPFVFTEQGVAMLSSVLKSAIALEVNINVMRAFVRMRKTIAHNALIYQRLDKLEKKHLITETKLDKVFEALEAGEVKPKQGIFYGGKIFDAYLFVADLIKSAKHSIVLIDHYIDESLLQLLTKRGQKVNASIYSKNITKSFQQDLKKHNSQYPSVSVKSFTRAHDRFLILILPNSAELKHLKHLAL